MTTTDAMAKDKPPVSVATGRGLMWVLACTLAAAVGITVARPVAELVRESLAPDMGGILTVALFGGLFGGCLGLGQALVRLGRHAALYSVWLVMASIISGALGYVLGAKLATVLTDPIRGKVLVYLSEALGYLVLGAVLGLLFGVTHALLAGLAHRRASGRGGMGLGMGAKWIALSMVGWALGFVAAAGVGLLITRLPSLTVRDLLFGGLAGLVAGSFEAPSVARWTGGRAATGGIGRLGPRPTQANRTERAHGG